MKKLIALSLLTLAACSNGTAQAVPAVTPDFGRVEVQKADELPRLGSDATRQQIDCLLSGSCEGSART